LLSALRRAHRREPLRPDFRVDSLIEAARAVPAGRAPGHRGGERLLLDDRQMLEVVDALASAGSLVREGRRVRLAEHAQSLDGEMRERVDRLLVGLTAARAEPPRVDSLAARLGIPPPVIEQLRAAGELVQAAPGIDYPRESWEALRARLERVSATGPLTVARVRDALHTSRRHAEALLALRRAEAERARRLRRRGG
jgi:hypothetical protein